MHVMIDLNMLGVRPDALITQISAIGFEFKNGGAVYNDKAFNAYIVPQDGQGSIDATTLLNWFDMAHARSLSANIINNGVLIEQALADFTKWAGARNWNSVEAVWSAPADLDLPILKSAFARFGAMPPWKSYKTRCVSTFLAMHNEVLGVQKMKNQSLDYANAFDNCLFQISEMQKLLPRGR